MKNKKTFFLVANATIPLFLGLVIYTFMKSGTYINTFLNIDFAYIPKTIIGIFIINWFCDFLWSYALVFALFLVLSPFKNRLTISCIVSLILGIVLETLQYANILSGTFDWWDIVIEVVAIVTVTFILKKLL